MSKLDEILAPYEFYPDHPFKQEIKDLLLELIGEDVRPNMYPGLLRDNQEAQNRLRKSLRKEVENL